MSKVERIWNWFIGIFLTLGNLTLFVLYAITKEHSPYRIVMSIFWLLYGVFKIAEMIDYTANKE